jgi:hypothetical protein
MLVILIGAFFCGIIAIQNPSKYVSVLAPSEYIVFLLSLLGILFIPYLSVFFIKWIFSKNAFLEIDEKGVYYGLSYSKEKQIYWEEIVDIVDPENRKSKKIGIIVKNPNRFIKGDIITKFFLEIEQNNYKTAIHINTYFLSGNFNDIKQSIILYWESYKERHKTT